MITNFILISALFFSFNQNPQSIISRYEKISRSLQNQGNIRPEDKSVLLDLFNKTELVIKSSPEDIRLPAISAQLALWLENDEMIDTSFERLIKR